MKLWVTQQRPNFTVDMHAWCTFHSVSFAVSGTVDNQEMNNGLVFQVRECMFVSDTVDNQEVNNGWVFRVRECMFEVVCHHYSLQNCQSDFSFFSSQDVIPLCCVDRDKCF